MKINCDVGEGFTNTDKAIMPYIDLANIACGGHAGNEQSMRNTIKLALQHGIKLGAHPSYPDKQNFGRITQTYPLSVLSKHLLEQIQTLATLCKQYNARLYHIKPHGALYNDLLLQPDLYQLLLDIMAKHFPHVTLIIQAIPNQTKYIHLAQKNKITLMFEAFADRRYADSGLLEPRSKKDAVLTHANDIYNQAERIIRHQHVETATATCPLAANTLCLHGDNPAALNAAKQIRTLL